MREYQIFVRGFPVNCDNSNPICISDVKSRRHGFGIRGSVTNQAMKANQHEAAEQIAEELANVIPR